VSLSPRTFGIRVVVTPCLAVAASLFSAITSSWWAAALMGFFGALLFTLVSERLLRGLLMGKIGKSPLSWYFVQLVGETVTIAVIALLFSLAFGAAIAASTAFWVFSGITWVFLCHEMLGGIARLLPLWLATRK
jgi:hypothetical protein